MLLVVLVDEALVCNALSGVVTFEFRCELFTILHQVTGVVERKLVHLDEVAAESSSYFNLEVLVRHLATFGEIDVALELVVGMENVLSNVILIVNEHPSVGITKCCGIEAFVFLADFGVEVSAPYLPVLPVTSGIRVGVATSYEAIVCGLDGFVGLEDSPCGQ